jgi:hypothetical protein
VPWNVTAVAPVKSVPVIETFVPGGPPVGENEPIVGGERVTANEPTVVAVPYGVVTEIGPVVAPVGTRAVMSVDESTTKAGSATPLKATLVAPVKFAPWMSTLVPTGPLVGENVLIVGGDAVTVNEPPLVAVPPGAVTEIGPLVAPAGTWAVMSVGELTTKLGSATPLNVTEVAPVKFVPTMSTLVLTVPPAGEKQQMSGGDGVTVNESGLVAVPNGVVTEIGPLAGSPQA